MNDFEKLKIPYPIIVEGKYDKLRLSSVAEAQIIATDGFGIFKNHERAALLRALARKTPLIVLTDSDGAGQLIRAHLSSALPKEKIIHLYTPRIEGKERRKKAPSKEGVLGVEGMEAERLRTLFAPFAADAAAKPRGRAVEKRDFYADGLSGGNGAAERRVALAAALDLPRGMSANALLDAINLLYTYDEYKKTIENL